MLVFRRPFDTIDYQNPQRGLRRLQFQAQLLAHGRDERHGIRIGLIPARNPRTRARQANRLRLRCPFQPIIDPVRNPGSIDHRPVHPFHPSFPETQRGEPRSCFEIPARVVHSCQAPMSPIRTLVREATGGAGIGDARRGVLRPGHVAGRPIGVPNELWPPRTRLDQGQSKYWHVLRFIMHRKLEPFRQQRLHHQAHLVLGGVARGFGLDIDQVRIDPFRQTATIACLSSGCSVSLYANSMYWTGERQPTNGRAGSPRCPS